MNKISNLEASNENAKLKRKNDDDSENSDSNSQEIIEAKKKIKIPIKLSVQSSAKTKQSSVEEETRKTTSTTTKSESKQAKVYPDHVPKLPSGNLAPSKKQPLAIVKNISEKVAKAFGSDSEDETEEMPIEAKMKMRNIGRNTPTSTGPNSYGKTGNLGFVDQRKLFEKQLKEKAEELLKEEKGPKNVDD